MLELKIICSWVLVIKTNKNINYFYKKSRILIINNFYKNVNLIKNYNNIYMRTMDYG